MKKFNILFVIAIFLVVISCGKRVTFEDEQYSSIGNSLETINNILSKTIPHRGYKYYDTLHSKNFRLFAFVWSNPKKKKFYIKTAEIYGKAPKVFVVKFMGNYYVKVASKVVVSCYGFSNRLPSFGYKEIKVDWNVFDRKDCDEGFKMKFEFKDDADRFASALSFLLSQYESEKEINYYSPHTNKNESANKEEKQIKSTNKCSVEKILKMKEIGLTVDEIKKVCE